MASGSRTLPKITVLGALKVGLGGGGNVIHFAFVAGRSATESRSHRDLVRGETTRLAPGMCFSDEPGIYIPGRFGVRLEDCVHMTEAGPKWFSTPPSSLDAPVR